MTFSTVAADVKTGDMGIAVASKFPGVEAVVPWAGPVATQAWAGEYNLEGRVRDDDLISQLLMREICELTPELDA
jgi:Family of unknown function (DUF1028)